MKATKTPVNCDAKGIRSQIITVRGENVILDSDLAALYGVATKVLNQAVKRNADRFPADFMFQLAPVEVENLRSQFVTSKPSILHQLAET